MKVYIKKPKIQGAWKWIQQGYKNAWESIGYDSIYYNSTEEIKTDEDYQLMIRDWDIKTQKDLEVINSSKRTYFFAQPNNFPDPWGKHPNFMTQCSDDIITYINSLDNAFLWSFIDSTEEKKHFFKWKKVHTIPLAFDDISYVPNYNEKFRYDVCFVGGWANNGFNEKKKIMIDIFSEFKKTNLKCGFFINKNISHDLETQIISSSKVCLNIHDAYQRILGYDTNERTFKSLGLNGALVCDRINKVNNMFPNVQTSLDSKQIVSLATETLQLSEKALSDQKHKNKAMILENHCYKNRVKKMLQL